MATSVAATAGVSVGIISEGTIIALTAIAVVGAIAIIAILKDKHLKIKVYNANGDGGEVEVY